MTDHTPDALPDDELVSRVLDGDASAADVARVEQDPVLAARLATFRRLSERVADVPEPPAGLLDSQVSAALGALGDVGGAVVDAHGVEAGPADAVTSIDAARQRRERWARFPLGAVAAGVLVIALVGAIGLVSSTSDDDADTVAASLDDAGDAGDLGLEEAFDAPAAAESTDRLVVPEAMSPAAGGSTGQASSSGALGGDDAASDGAAPAESDADAGPTPTYDTVEDLVAGYTETYGASDDADVATRTDVEPGGPDDPCDAVTLLQADADRVLTLERVVVEGADATVVVHDTDRDRRVGAVAFGSCDVVVDTAI